MLTGADPERVWTRPLQVTRTWHSWPAQFATAELGGRFDGVFGESSTPHPAVVANARPTTIAASVDVDGRRTHHSLPVVRAARLPAPRLAAAAASTRADARGFAHASVCCSAST